MEEKLSQRQIDALLEILDVKNQEYVEPFKFSEKKEQEADLRVSTNQNDWDYLMKLPISEFKKIVLRRELDKAEQVILVLRRNHDLIMTYLADRVFTSDKALIELAKRRIPSEIEAATKRSALPDEAMIYLIENGFQDIRNYLLRRGALSRAAETALIKRGRSHDIMNYIKHFSMYPAGVCELIKRGKHDEIMMIIKRKNNLFGYNLKLLIERGNRKEIEYYLSRYNPQVKIPE